MPRIGQSVGRQRTAVVGRARDAVGPRVSHCHRAPLGSGVHQAHEVAEPPPDVLHLHRDAGCDLALGTDDELIDTGVANRRVYRDVLHLCRAAQFDELIGPHHFGRDLWRPTRVVDVRDALRENRIDVPPDMRAQHRSVAWRPRRMPHRFWATRPWWRRRPCVPGCCRRRSPRARREGASADSRSASDR